MNYIITIEIPDDPQIVEVRAGDWKLELSEVYRETLEQEADRR